MEANLAFICMLGHTPMICCFFVRDDSVNKHFATVLDLIMSLCHAVGLLCHRLGRWLPPEFLNFVYCGC